MVTAGMVMPAIASTYVHTCNRPRLKLLWLGFYGSAPGVLRPSSLTAAADAHTTTKVLLALRLRWSSHGS